jgi:Xaa-Pro aminopeptidase
MGTTLGCGRHGTGHGVGHFLNVHEGPQGIGTRITYNETHLKAGMTVSNGASSFDLNAPSCGGILF